MTEDEVKLQENEKRQKELSQAYKRLFMSDDGKKVLEDLRIFCGQDRSSVCEQDPNLNQTLYAEGKRRVFLRIQGLIRRNEK